MGRVWGGLGLIASGFRIQGLDLGFRYLPPKLFRNPQESFVFGRQLSPKPSKPKNPGGPTLKPTPETPKQTPYVNRCCEGSSRNSPFLSQGKPAVVPCWILNLKTCSRGLGLALLRMSSISLTELFKSIRCYPKPYLNPEEPTFLGFPIMISLYKSVKR